MSDLDALKKDLQRVSYVSPQAGRKILQEVADEAKKHWQEAASTGRSASRYARRISYETSVTASGAEGEIGATLGKSGSLGILDDPISTGGITSTPSRARRSTSKFIEGEFEKRGSVVVDGFLKGSGL